MCFFFRRLTGMPLRTAQQPALICIYLDALQEIGALGVALREQLPLPLALLQHLQDHATLGRFSIQLIERGARPVDGSMKAEIQSTKGVDQGSPSHVQSNASHLIELAVGNRRGRRRLQPR